MLTQGLSLPRGCKIDATAPDIMFVFKAERREVKSRTRRGCPFNGKSRSFPRNVLNLLSFSTHWLNVGHRATHSCERSRSTEEQDCRGLGSGAGRVATTDTEEGRVRRKVVGGQLTGGFVWACF